MIRKPFPDEWDVSGLPSDRRKLLDGDLSFEEMLSRMGAKVVRARIEPYQNPPQDEKSEAREARQAIFVVRVASQTCDLLYNAPDGLRGRYWQSPDHGFDATRQIIVHLLDDLLLFAENHPPTCEKNVAPMNAEVLRHRSKRLRRKSGRERRMMLATGSSSRSSLWSGVGRKTKRAHLRHTCGPTGRRATVWKSRARF